MTNLILQFAAFSRGGNPVVFITERNGKQFEWKLCHGLPLSLFLSRSMKSERLTESHFFPPGLSLLYRHIRRNRGKADGPSDTLGPRLISVRKASHHPVRVNCINCVRGCCERPANRRRSAFWRGTVLLFA